MRMHTGETQENKVDHTQFLETGGTWGSLRVSQGAEGPGARGEFRP